MRDDDSDPADSLYEELANLRADRDAARQALWDIYGILGYDQDGDTTPAALTSPPLEDLVRDAAREYRKEADSERDEALRTADRYKDKAAGRLADTRRHGLYPWNDIPWNDND